jgi:hypothetical protein
MQMFRDFWFQILLDLAGAAVGFLSISAEGTPRRVWASAAVVLFALAAISYIWGDPVRGPFAKLVHPRTGDTFWLHAGVAVGFPVTQLKNGIDFSRAVSMPGQPIRLWVSRRWWSGWRYNLTAMGPNNVPVLQFTNDSIQVIPSGWQLNADDWAVEVVDEHLLPRLQVIQASDYDVYVNVVLYSATQAIVLKDDRLEMKPTNALTGDDFPNRMFKYPAYAHRGERQ